MSWRGFRSNLRSIALLAVGCVIFTAVAVAEVSHYLLGCRWPWLRARRHGLAARRGGADGDRAPSAACRGGSTWCSKAKGW